MKNGHYELIKAPADYPGKLYRGKYAYEHHVVWWRHTGRTVSDGHVIHHKNGQKRDNRIENLQLMNRSEHSSHHAREKGVAMVRLVCPSCGCEFVREKRLTHIVKPTKASYCSRECVGKSAYSYDYADQVIEEFVEYN